MRRALLATLVALSTLVLMPSAAHACSCVGGADDVFSEWADVVVTGTLVDVEPARRAVGNVEYVVTVDRVYKGASPELIRISSASNGAACGLEGMAAQRRYLFFLDASRDEFWANLCGGTRAVGDQPILVLGSQGAVPTVAPAVQADEPRTETGGAAELTASDLSWPIALGGGGLLVVMVCLLW